MTEGFEAFRQAISNLETAAGGGGGTYWYDEPGDAPGWVQYPDDRTPAEIFSDQTDDYRYGNMDSRPSADPGYAWAEDGTQVPLDYWD